MARRIGDDGCSCRPCSVVPLAVWSPGSAGLRLELTAEAAEVRPRVGDEPAVDDGPGVAGQCRVGVRPGRRDVRPHRRGT